VALLNRELKEKESAGLEAKSTNTPPTRIFVPRRFHVTSEPPAQPPLPLAKPCFTSKIPWSYVMVKKFRTSVMMILIRVEIGQPPSVARANPKITAGGDRKSPSSPVSCWKSPTKTKKAFQLIWSFIPVTDSIIKALKTGEFLDLEFPTTQLIMPPYLKNLGESKLSHLKITVDWEDDMRTEMTIIWQDFIAELETTWNVQYQG